jgi:hypothetical protein
MYFLNKNEYRMVKPVEIIRRWLKKKEKNERDEPIQDTMHIYMELS